MQIRYKKHKKILLPSILVVVAVAGYFSVAYATKATWPFTQKATTDASSQQKTTATNTINYNPPTKQEVASSQDGKKSGANAPTTTPKTVDVDISYADKSSDGKNIEVRAFTTGVIEGDGTCLATLTNGSHKVTDASAGFIDATSTICQPIEIPLTKLAAGTWQLVVTYTSKDVTGTSTPVEVKI